MVNFALIPAYNESKHIAGIVRQVSKIGLKPVVIDDGSKDNTYDVAVDSGAICIRHERNKGKGEALKTGLEHILKHYPSFDYLILIDADNQYAPQEALKILRELEEAGADFVMGYRDWSLVPFRHQLGNFVWRTAFNILFGTKLKDTNCGLMGFDKKAVEKIKDSILGGYIVDNSILIGALKNRLKMSQVEVKVSYHRKSGVRRGTRVVLDVLYYIVKEGLKYRFGR
ncbi:MAG: glycosyltransferase family 2 protein [Candidatus Aenigmarchaeota archaeon]|nr:glycosyltransferase family 2 protein [Candidatus Aenigmarchaeota archaeon]